mmetsp:Transcript_3118/g.9075  ORF Transcript_3118/g.9075 Transcript_3118/m.9075 type:complete len:250 (+) Transcript_3118:168-917(+)
MSVRSWTPCLLRRSDQLVCPDRACLASHRTRFPRGSLPPLHARRGFLGVGMRLPVAGQVNVTRAREVLCCHLSIPKLPPSTTPVHMDVCGERHLPNALLHHLQGFVVELDCSRQFVLCLEQVAKVAVALPYTRMIFTQRLTVNGQGLLVQRLRDAEALLLGMHVSRECVSVTDEGVVFGVGRLPDVRCLAIHLECLPELLHRLEAIAHVDVRVSNDGMVRSRCLAVNRDSILEGLNCLLMLAVGSQSQA